MATPHFVNRENMIADSEYIQWLSDVKKRFRESQGRALVKVNAEMLEFYWSIGRDLVVLKAESRWGESVVKQFAFDMREAFPNATGFSYSNVKYMKQWYLFYNQQVEKSQRPVGLFGNKDEYSQLEKSQCPIGLTSAHKIMLQVQSEAMRFQPLHFTLYTLHHTLNKVQSEAMRFLPLTFRL